MRKTLFIKNALILSVTSVALRFLGMVFKVKAAYVLGGGGIGIYYLAFSVFVLCEGTVTSGISLSVTRLVSEKPQRDVCINILKMCIFIAVSVSAVIGFAVFGFSYPIASLLLKNVQSAFVLKSFCFVLPVCAVSACLKGYFLGRQNVMPVSIAVTAEQTVRLLFTFLLIEKAAAISQYHGAALIFAGSAIGEAAGCTVLFAFLKSDIKKLPAGNAETVTVFDVLHIAFPVSATKFCNSVLRTAENLLIPIRLAAYSGGEAAISSFGTLKGMALPVLLFPCTLLNSLSGLLIPEMSKALSLKRRFVIKYAIEKCLKISLLVGLLSGVCFFVFGGFLGNLIYKNAEASLYIKLLAPIVPLMYLDSIADGLLKGLDCQKTLFKNSIADSVLRIILILVFLSKKGMPAFILIMYFSNVLTCSLNLKKLLEFLRTK